MKREIIPAILAHSADEARVKIEQIEKLSRWIQWDVMDGKFVPNSTWSDPTIVKKWNLCNKIELHLMVENPLRVIQQWRQVSNFKRAVWHIEAPVDHEKLIAICHRTGFEAGLALSPQTPLAALVPFLRKIETAVILGVKPGWSGQKLIPSTVRKAEDLHILTRRMPIGFDGHITRENLPKLAQAGVSRFYVASAIFSKKDPINAFRQLNDTLSKIT